MSTDTSATTEPGSYFISNYPPFSVWDSTHVPSLETALEQPPASSVPLGLYIHIPFCRKRCKFCYFRVYTNQNAKAIEQYVQSLIREIGNCCLSTSEAARRLTSVPGSCGHCVTACRPMSPGTRRGK